MAMTVLHLVAGQKILNLRMLVIKIKTVLIQHLIFWREHKKNHSCFFAGTSRR